MIGKTLNALATIWPLMALYGVYMALTNGVGKAMISEHSPCEARGASMGLFYALTVSRLLQRVCWLASFGIIPGQPQRSCSALDLHYWH